MIPTDIYPVGILEDIHVGRLRYSLRTSLWPMLRRRRWRALRSYFNGYLAEHDGCDHNCGRGWTRQAALASANRICALAARHEEQVVE